MDDEPMEKKMTVSEFDALKETGNVGIGNAATSLAELIGKKVDINIPETRFVDISQFSQEIGGPETIVTAIYLEINGDLTGESLFVFDEESSKEMSDLILGNERGTTKVIGEDETSALNEMANIFIGSYLNAFADMLDKKILPSVPHTATDMAQSIVDFMLAKLAKHSDQILIVKEKITIDGHSIDGTFIALFDEASLEKTLEALRTKYDI